VRHHALDSAPGTVFTPAGRTPRRGDQTNRGARPTIQHFLKTPQPIAAPLDDAVQLRSGDVPVKRGNPGKFHSCPMRINSAVCAELSYSSGQPSADEWF
jgi:hypothetical protein